MYICKFWKQQSWIIQKTIERCQLLMGVVRKNWIPIHFITYFLLHYYNIANIFDVHTILFETNLITVHRLNYNFIVYLKVSKVSIKVWACEPIWCRKLLTIACFVLKLVRQKNLQIHFFTLLILILHFFSFPTVFYLDWIKFSHSHLINWWI